MEECFCLLSSWIFQAHGLPEAVMFTCVRTRCSKGKWLSTPPWHIQERWERKIKEHVHRVFLRRGENTSYMHDQIRRGQRYNERDIALHETWELAKLMSSIYSSPPPELLPPLHMHTHAIHNHTLYPVGSCISTQSAWCGLKASSDIDLLKWKGFMYYENTLKLS